MITDASLSLALLAVAFAATLLGRFIFRRFAPPLRPLAAYDRLPALAADAVESQHTLHFSLGSSTLGDNSTLSALVAAEVIYRLSERLAISRQPPVITLADPLALPLAQDTLRRAYAYRQNMDYYRATAAIWFPQGPRSLAFAAGVASWVADVDATSTLTLGRFGPELALIGESALRHSQQVIAHSDRVEGQAVAYAQAADMLLGEELYVGPAYLDGTALERGGVFALDVLRWLVILGIVVAALEAALS